MRTDATFAELRKTVEAAVSLLQERTLQIKDGQNGEPGPRGQDADPDEVALKAAELVLAQLPAPQDGKDADPEMVAELVLARIPMPANGRDGDSGKDAEVDYQRLQDAIDAAAAREVEKHLTERIALLPQPEPGSPGRDGKDADADVVAALVLERMPLPRDGADGKSVTLDDVIPLVEEIVQKTVSELPLEKGEKGDPGERGEKGETGESGPAGDPGDMDFGAIQAIQVSMVATGFLASQAPMAVTVSTARMVLASLTP